MALEGIAAVQARIQEIQQQVDNVLAPTTGDTSTQGKTGADFASLLTDAMNTQAASGIGSADSLNGDTSTSGSSGSSLLSGLVSDLTGSGATSGTGSAGSSDLSSLVASLTGGGSTGTSDISSLISS